MVDVYRAAQVYSTGTCVRARLSRDLYINLTARAVVAQSGKFVSRTFYKIVPRKHRLLHNLFDLIQ